ncbi:Alpha/Beta hydrolase protein [Gorgonomyces haynaldii]|nr:Alpha/Beta hydrolase protein [Gorgonomyces haynaldii]
MESFELNSLKKRKHIVPDHTDPETVLTLAKMTLDSYYEPGQSGWLPIPGYNVTAKFGWEQTGIRGYLFQDTDQDVLVIVIKGTSLATPIGSGPTAKLDKLNDNMMFSCCCAKAGWEWTPICNCPTDSNHCSKSCLLRESNFDGSYYNLAQTIYLAVQEWFPKRTAIWMAGHSLGGALATLVALTNNVPAFAFQAPGDMLYASRLGLLPDVPDLDAYLDDLSIYHFGNDKDPIYMGQCRGVTSSCYWFDYALESKCHVGKECIYRLDQPSLQKQDLGDNVDIFTAIQYHSIEYVINNILDKRDPVPKCELKRNCLATECTQWEFTD